MEGNSLNPPGINKSFFTRLNANQPNDLKFELASDSLKNVLAKEIKLKT